MQVFLTSFAELKDWAILVIFFLNGLLQYLHNKVELLPAAHMTDVDGDKD